MSPLARLEIAIQAAAKRLRLGVEGPKCAEELEAAVAALPPVQPDPEARVRELMRMHTSRLDEHVAPIVEAARKLGLHEEADALQAQQDRYK